MKKIFKRIPQAAYSIMSLAAVAAINYSIIHNTFVFICVIVLLAHELGHYFAAKINKGIPKLPIFLPLPFIAIALTKITELDPKGIQQTAFYGPFAGFLAAVTFLLFNLILNFTSSISLIMLAISEIVFNYIGSDGAKYRRARKMNTSCLL
jgi:hypothetical protein